MSNAPTRRGRLKVFLGYAAGVGKTYKMLSEARELTRKGCDIVVGYFEPHGRADTIALARDLEVIPRKQVTYRDASFEEIDTDAILRRKPEVCAVDEFPHTNVPGSEREKRWQDVELLLNAGIDVLTTMNVQHLESLNDQVFNISGIRVRETVPDWVVEQADEVVMVDLSPRALLHRLERGVVYAPEKAQTALQNFFKEATLVALRELALRQTAHELEMRESATTPGGVALAPQQDRVGNDRILILVTADPSAAMLIRRAKRVADYLHAECFAVHVEHSDGQRRLSAEEQERIEQHLNFARNLHIETRFLQGDDLARTLVDFARLRGVTQIFLTKPRDARGPGLMHRPLLYEIVRLARDMQVTIVAARRKTK